MPQSASYFIVPPPTLNKFRQSGKLLRLWLRNFPLLKALCIMNKLLISIFLLTLPSISRAMTCTPDQGLEQRFKEADSVLLIEVTSTKLKRLKYDGEEVKYSLTTYELVESFKGSTKQKGKVIEILGYGAGMIGLVPGIYYFVLLDNDTGIFDYPPVHMCNTLGSTLNLKGSDPVQQIEQLRILK